MLAKAAAFWAMEERVRFMKKATMIPRTTDPTQRNQKLYQRKAAIGTCVNQGRCFMCRYSGEGRDSTPRFFAGQRDMQGTGII